MKKQIIISMIAILLLINTILAGTQFYMTKNDLGNKIIENRMLFCYDKKMSAILPDIKDYVSGNNYYEAYILYSIYVKKWNNDNPNYMIDYCNMTIYQSTTQTNYTNLTYLYYTQADSDLNNAKYFLRMKDGDCVVVEQQCKYNQYVNQSNLDIPADMQFVTPTWECKACQRYEWSLVDKDIQKAEIMNVNVLSVSDFIKKLILLNFEIILMLFWVFLILMIFISIGFIFMSVYWLYLFLIRSVT